MFKPSYQLSSETITLISEISEQLGILKNLTNSNTETVPEQPFNPFDEEDLMRAHENIVDRLSEGAGQ